MFLLYLQQGVTIVNRNLPIDGSLAPEKLSTVLFGRARLKIIMSRGLRNVPILHKQLVPVRHKIWDRRLEIACVGIT